MTRLLPVLHLVQLFLNNEELKYFMNACCHWYPQKNLSFRCCYTSILIRESFISLDSLFAAGVVAAFESGLRRVWRSDFHCSLLRAKKAPGYHPHFRGS